MTGKTLEELKKEAFEAIDRIRLRSPTRKEEGYDGAVSDFKVGDRIEVIKEGHEFLRGDRFGAVKKVRKDRVYVRLDRSGRTLPFDAANLRRVTDADSGTNTGGSQD